MLLCHGEYALTGSFLTGTYQPFFRWVLTPPPAPAGPSPEAVLAARAAGHLTLPSPTLGMSPPGTGFVNFPEWLWIDPSLWHQYSMTVTATNAVGSTSVTATATPVDVVWNTGDATAPTICYGPGTPYNLSEPPSAQRTACAHSYTISSIGQPSPDGNPNDAAFTVTATIQWHVRWTASNGATGTAPTLTTAASTRLRVEQIEAAICDTTCPPPGPIP